MITKIQKLSQVSSDQKYYSAKQEYYPQFHNQDSGVVLISKELQVPFASSKENVDSDGCEEAHVSDVTQDIQNEQASKQLIKTSNYEVRRPGIRKEFYDIEEKVFIKPAGSAIFELQHDKPHSSAIVSKHIYQKQTYPQQYADDESQYYPQQTPFVYSRANHGYNPVIIQTPSIAAQNPGYGYNPETPSIAAQDPGYGYNPVVVQQPARPQFVPYRPPTYNYKPVFPSTTVTPEYIPPVKDVPPPCDDSSNQYPPSTPQPPSHEFSDEHDEDEHDYDSDADFIDTRSGQTREDNKEFVDVQYAQNKSYSNRERDDYSKLSPVYNIPESHIDRVRNEYQNERGDLAQQKLNQRPEQFHHEYVPQLNQKQVEVRPNGAPLAKYSEERGSNQAEIENSRRLIDLYSANGDVTEIGFNGNARSQQYQVPNNNAGGVRARVVSVTPAPKYAEYVDEQTKSRRVVLSKPLYTVQKVEVREHNHRLVEDIQSDSVEPKVSDFEKYRIIGKSSSDDQAEFREQQAEYITPVPQEYAHLRAGSPVPETLQK